MKIFLYTWSKIKYLKKKNLQISQFFYHLKYKCDFLIEKLLFVFHLEIKVHHPVT